MVGRFPQGSDWDVLSPNFRAASVSSRTPSERSADVFDFLTHGETSVGPR